jgi:hypothetical protein
MDMPVILATRHQRSAERCSRRQAEGRFAAQASEEPFRSCLEGSFRSRGVKFRPQPYPRPRCSRRRSAGGADETPHEERSDFRHSRFVGSDEDGGSSANIAASEASD